MERRETDSYGTPRVRFATPNRSSSQLLRSGPPFTRRGGERFSIFKKASQAAPIAGVVPPVSVRQAVRGIDSGTIQYFVRSGDHIVPVRTVGGRYLRTQADDSSDNNLGNHPRG